MLIANINAFYWWINNKIIDLKIPTIIHIIIITIIITIVK